MNPNLTDQILDTFRKNNPFTYLPPEVVALVRYAAEAGYNCAVLDNWCPEEVKA